MLRNAASCLRRQSQCGVAYLQKRGFADVRNVKEVSQAETKGKPASEAPLKPSVWKGEQRGHLVLGITGVLACGLGWVWFKGQNADKANLGNTNYKGEGKDFPAASHT
ncbi:hypothetical protein ABBQ32_005061 [Trebouxia sp. C0010 RCD-2024]